MDDWPAQLVEDALERIRAESAWEEEQEAKRKQREAVAAAGGVTLGDEFPDLEE